jgi:hypothetical protein
MSRIDDGSDELNAAIRAVSARPNAELAEILDKWATDGVRIHWADFEAREVLRVVALRLKSLKTQPAGARGIAESGNGEAEADRDRVGREAVAQEGTRSNTG